MTHLVLLAEVERRAEKQHALEESGLGVCLEEN